MVEELENRYVPSQLCAAVGFEVQTVANPNAGVNNMQYVTAGSWQTVSTLPVNVTAGDAGAFNLVFTASARSNSSSDLVKVRYLLDGYTDRYDPATVYDYGRGSDLIESMTQNSYGNWVGLNLTKQLQLTEVGHTYTITVQVQSAASAGNGGHDLEVWNPVLQVTGFNNLHNQSAAVCYAVETAANPNTASLNNNTQYIPAGSWQTVSILQIPKNDSQDPAHTNNVLFNLAFSAYVSSSSSNDLVKVRYLQNGSTDGNDDWAAANTPGNDLTVTLTGNSYGNWAGLYLTRYVRPFFINDTCTITVQVQSAASAGSGGQDLEVWDPCLQITGYNSLDLQSAACIIPSGQVANSNAGDSYGQAQYVSAGSFQTVSTLTYDVDPARAGLFNLTFTAYAQSCSASDCVNLRYLIDGQLDPTDLASNSSGGSDLTETMSQNSYGNFIGLSLTRQLTLSPGTHTISIQVEGAADSGTGGKDLEVWAPCLQLTGAYVPVTASMVADFQGQGVWVYINKTWQQLSPAEASSVALDDHGDVAAAFGNGVWIFYAGAADWQYLTPALPSQIDIAGSGIFVGEFPGNGVWRYGFQGKGWEQLTPANALCISVDDQGEFVGSFAANGTWILWSNYIWKQLSPAVADQITLAPSGYSLAATFPGNGTWSYEIAFSIWYPPGWHQLTPATATTMAVGYDTAVACAFANGVWLIGGTRITYLAPWQHVGPGLPTQLGMANISDLFAEFPGSGVWEYTSSGGWLQLTPADAKLLRGAGG
jgi:hypothetical protein